MVELTLIANYLVCKLAEASFFVCHRGLAGAVIAQIKNVWKSPDARLRKMSEPFPSRQYLVFVVVEVRAVSLGAINAMFALLLFEETGMVFLLFPPVGEAALVLEWAAICEGGNKCVRLPIRAHFVTIREFVGLAAVVLPVVGVKANFAVMVIFFIRTPNCFEMVQIEICVNFVFFDHFYRKL